VECKDIRKLCRALKKEGATIERTAKSHWLVTFKGQVLVMPRNAGSPRNLLNIKADIRRTFGVEL
jgi:hypothetical protein